MNGHEAIPEKALWLMPFDRSHVMGEEVSSLGAAKPGFLEGHWRLCKTG